MNWKWYIPLLVVVFAFAGMTNQKSAQHPNQEILVEFSEIEVDDSRAEAVISEITSHLKSLGAENIRISRLPQGKLKIQYFSTLDVSEVQDILDYSDIISTKNGVADKSDKTPSQENHTYNIAVIQIQKDADKPFHGTTVDILRLQDNFVKPKLITSAFLVSIFKEFTPTVEREPFFTEKFEYTSQYIRVLPEIRAGPSV